MLSVFKRIFSLSQIIAYHLLKLIISNNIAYVNENIEKGVDKLLLAIYNVVKSNAKGGKLMSKAQETLKKEIEKIDDESTIEKVRIFIMGILAQQRIEKDGEPQAKTA